MLVTETIYLYIDAILIYSPSSSTSLIGYHRMDDFMWIWVDHSATNLSKLATEEAEKQNVVLTASGQWLQVTIDPEDTQLYGVVCSISACSLLCQLGIAAYLGWLYLSKLFWLFNRI